MAAWLDDLRALLMAPPVKSFVTRSGSVKEIRRWSGSVTDLAQAAVEGSIQSGFAGDSVRVMTAKGPKTCAVGDYIIVERNGGFDVATAAQVVRMYLLDVIVPLTLDFAS